MGPMTRRIRGALGIGVTWGVMWVGLGLVVSLVIGALRPGDIGSGEGMKTVLPVFGLVGFLSGLGFAAWLSVAERRRTLDQLSLFRVALGGLLGGVAIPLLMGADGSMGWITGPMGAAFAAASVGAARRKALPRIAPPGLLE
jgi:hypothetical protein